RGGLAALVLPRNRRTVVRLQLPGQPLPADLQVTPPVPGALQPVRDTWIALADHEPHPAVRVSAGLIGGEAGLVIDVVQRDVPQAAELDSLIGRGAAAGRRHG